MFASKPRGRSMGGGQGRSAGRSGGRSGGSGRSGGRNGESRGDKRSIGGARGGDRNNRERIPGANRRGGKGTKFYSLKNEKLDYKNLPLLQKYLTERGKILSRRFTGISAVQQRQLTNAIKLARFLGVLPSGSARA